MRTRETGYKHYGFKDEEVKMMKKWCKSGDFKEFSLLLECARKTNESIFNDIYFSIVRGISYDRLDKMIYQNIGRGDFYGYQRKTLALFRDALIERKRYPFMAKV